MRAHLRHPNFTTKKEKGKLPKWVYQSEFMADLGRRKKSVEKYFYKLANASVGTSRVTKGMAKRLKKNWGYMVKQNKGKSIEELIESAKARLEYLFNNHTYCKFEWCNGLKSQLAGKP